MIAFLRSSHAVRASHDGERGLVSMGGGRRNERAGLQHRVHTILCWIDVLQSPCTAVTLPTPSLHPHAMTLFVTPNPLPPLAINPRPMTVFLTPDLEPIVGGTYFPKQDAYGRPGFLT